MIQAARWKERRLCLLSLLVLTAFVLGFACTSTLKQIGTGLSDSIELSLSKSLAASVVEQTPMVEDPLAKAYLDSLTQLIGRNSGRSDLEYQTFIVDSDEINAFTVGGGYIFYNKGLIARSRNESQLAGVIAHEIGHNVARHLTKTLVTRFGVAVVTAIAMGENPSQSREIAAALLGLGGTLFTLHLSREHERDADSLGVEELIATGIDPSGLPSFFGVLRDFYGDRGGGIELYFADHPPLVERIAHTERIIARSHAYSTRPGALIKDSPRFGRIRERTRWLTHYAGVDTFMVEPGEKKVFALDVKLKEADRISMSLDLQLQEGTVNYIRLAVTDSTGLALMEKGESLRKTDFVQAVGSGRVDIPVTNQARYFVVFDNSISPSSAARIIARASLRYKAF